MKTHRSDTGIDGVHNRSWPATLLHHRRLMGAADRAACCFRINPHTYKLQVTWEGNHWGSEGVERRLGELPREKIITELRALRRASRDGTDPLMLRLARMKPTVFRKFLDRKVTRISAGTALLIPPALIDRRHHYLP